MKDLTGRLLEMPTMEEDVLLFRGLRSSFFVDSLFDEQQQHLAQK